MLALWISIQSTAQNTSTIEDMLRRMNGYTGGSLPGNLYSITIYAHTALKNCNSDDLIDVLRNIVLSISKGIKGVRKRIPVAVGYTAFYCVAGVKH